MYGHSNTVQLYLERYDDYDKIAIICWSNSYLQNSNDLIRAELGLSGPLTVGDRVIQNQNYYGKNGGFSGSGEIGVVSAIGATYKIAGLIYKEVNLTFRNTIGEVYSIQGKILIDALYNPKVLTRETKQSLFAHALKSNPVFRQSKQVWDDEFISAMVAGFAHSFTCHKAQGSEWETVLFNSWMPKDAPDNRFLYTGVTRARNELYTKGAHAKK